MPVQEIKAVDDYWMALARAALKAVLKDDAARHGQGALPIRTLDFILDLQPVELDAAMLTSADTEVRQSWGEILRVVALSLRTTLLVIVKTVLSTFPDQLIHQDDIPHVVNAFQFELV